MLAEAKRECDRILGEAREQAAREASQTEIVKLAERQAQDVESVFIMASPQYSFLSSSGVKELATFGGDITELVPPHVEGPLKEALARR